MRKIYLIGLILILFSSFVSGGVVINEMMPNADQEWIEIYNNGSSSVNLTDWYLTDNIGMKYNFTETLLPQNYLVVDVNGLNNPGDNITLFNNTDVYIDGYNYTSSTGDFSWGRMHDGLGTWVEFSSDDVTKGSANNIKPVITTILDQNVNEDSDFNYQVVASDLNDDSLLYSITSTAGVSINQSGYVEWIGPDNDDVGKYNVSVFVDDSYSVVNETFELEVLNTNDVPVITTILNQNVNEDSDFNYQVVANDVDGDTLSYSLTSVTGAIINSTDGFINWSAPDNDDIGEYEFIVFVDDSFGAVNETFNVTVDNVNDDPVITNGASAPVVATEGLLYAYQFAASDIDPTNDTFTFGLSVNPNPMNISINQSGYLSGTPIDGGDYIYNVTVSDGNGGSDEYQVDVSVDNALDFLSFNINGASLSNGSTYSILPGDLLTLAMQVEDNLNVDINDVQISTSITGLSLSNQTNLFSIDPSPSEIRTLTYMIPYDVSEGNYYLNADLTGTDEDGAARAVSNQYTLSLLKQNHFLRIDSLSLSDDNLSCFRGTTLTLDLMNIGESDEDNIEVRVLNSQLGIDETQTILYLAEDGSHVLNFDLDVVSEFDGNYPLSVSVDYSGLILSDSINLELNTCVDDVVVDEDSAGFIINLDSSYSYTEISQSNTSLINCNFVTETCSGPSADQIGFSDLNFSATDGVDTFYNTFSIYVVGKNDAPVLDFTELTQPISFEEDGMYELDLSSYASDIDGDYLYWSYLSDGNISVSFSGSVATFSAVPEWFGSEDVNITVSDGNEIDSEILNVVVSDVDDSTVISSYNPAFDPILGLNEQKTFLVDAYDPDGAIVYNWLRNGVSVGNTASYVFSSASAGDFNLTLDVVNDSHAWSIIVTDVPITNSFDGSTTDFSLISDLSSVSNVVLEKIAYGKIEFNDTLDLSSVYDLDNYVAIGNVVAIDSNKYPTLNKPAVITMKHQSYKGIPKIYYTSAYTTDASAITNACDFCTVLSHTDSPTSDGEVKFYVDHFSSFKVGYEIVLNYTDVDTCSSGEIGDLELDIEEPDDDEEYAPGEEITVEVEVENNGNDDKDVKVVAELYDVDDNDVVDRVTKTLEVDEDDEETFELILEVPNGVDDGNEFIVFVKAYEKGSEDEHCAENTVDVDIEREDHKVVIEDFNLRSAASCGEIVEASVEIENVGSSDEDVIVTIENTELGIYEESSEYELDDYEGDDEDAIVRFNIKLPLNAETKTYSLKAKVEYEDGSSSLSEDLELYSCGLSVKTYAQLSISDLNLVVPEVNVKAGESITVPVKIRNDDDYKKSYSLGFENLAGWGVPLGDTKIVSVEPNMESTEYLYMKVNKDVNSGMHTATVKLSSAEGVSSKNVNVAVQAVKKPIFVSKAVSGWNASLMLICLVLLLVLAYLFKLAFGKKRI